MKKLVKRLLLPGLVLFGGVMAAVLMVVLSNKAERSAPPPQVLVVEVEQVRLGDAVAKVRSSGVVQPAQRIGLVAEVNGAIVRQSDQLLPGGRFNKGDTLAQVDPRMYRLALRQQESALKQAELNLQLEQGRGEVAQKEWQLLGLEAPQDDAPLAMRKPQLVTAEVAVEAARAGLDQARLNLEKSTLRAPFNAVVLEEQVDVGQVVGPGSPVATLIGSDRFWVTASVPVDRLSVIDVPGLNAERGSTVTVTQDLGRGESVQRQGTVLRLGGQLDPQTRTAQLVVAVDNPMETQPGQLPLLPGAFVDLHISGRSLPQVMTVPRGAVSDGDTVWVVAADDTLSKRTVEVAWRGEQSLYVSKGLDPEEPIVVSALSLPVEGQPVQVQSTTPDQSAAAINPAQ